MKKYISPTSKVYEFEAKPFAAGDQSGRGGGATERYFRTNRSTERDLGTTPFTEE